MRLVHHQQQQHVHNSTYFLITLINKLIIHLFLLKHWHSDYFLDYQNVIFSMHLWDMDGLKWVILAFACCFTPCNIRRPFNTAGRKHILKARVGRYNRSWRYNGLLLHYNQNDNASSSSALMAMALFYTWSLQELPKRTTSIIYIRTLAKLILISWSKASDCMLHHR